MGPGNSNITTIAILYDEQKPLGQDFFKITTIVILFDEQNHGARKL